MCLSSRIVLGCGGRVSGRRVFLALLQRRLEFSLGFAEVLGEFRQLRTAEQHQYNHQDQDEFRRSDIHTRDGTENRRSRPVTRTR
jgi:hypothetical protein